MKLGTCEQGLVATHVEENSVAELIGLKTGDIIFKVTTTETKVPSAGSCVLNRMKLVFVNRKIRICLLKSKIVLTFTL